MTPPIKLESAEISAGYLNLSTIFWPPNSSRFGGPSSFCPRLSAQSLRGLRKCYAPEDSRIRILLAPSRQDAKFEIFFSYLCAFASLREIFRSSVAALPCYAGVVNFFQIYIIRNSHSLFRSKR